MVKLRLRRKGRTHHPMYDIVAVDSRKKRDSDFIERLGYYNPHTQPSTVSIDPDRAVYWLNTGAQPTHIVGNLLSYEGVLLRRTMLFKGKNQLEIEEAVANHKKTVVERYKRRKILRAKREEKKAKDAAEAAEEKKD
jgi:small subunit ribosomal protein S16